MTTTTITERDLEGKVLAGYYLEKKLGSGGFGTVYRAIHPRLKRKVAVKCLHLRGAALDEAVTHEIDILDRLDHPHIVRILDHFPSQEPPVHLIMMQFVPGGTLREFLARDANQRLDPATVALMLGQVCRALDYLHDERVLHLDIKPENILLNSRTEQDDLNFFLTDFGIARLLDKQYVKGARGTPGYMAPEQFQASNATGQDEIGPAADIYELGVVLYELLTGYRPFRAAGMVELASQHLTEAPVPPARLVPELPPALDAVVLRALAKRPADRYTRAGDLGRAFQAAVGPVGSGQGVAERLMGEFARQQSARAQAEIPTATALSLKVIGPDGNEHEYQFAKTSILAGNQPGVDLPLDDPALAGMAFRIDWTPEGQVKVVDMGGSASLFLGGSKPIPGGTSAEWSARHPLMVNRFLLKSSLNDITMTAPALSLNELRQTQARSLPPRILTRLSQEILEARIGQGYRFTVTVAPENTPPSIYRVFVRELPGGLKPEWVTLSDPKPIRDGESATFDGLLTVQMIRAGDYQLLLGIAAEDRSIPDLAVVVKVVVKPEPRYSLRLNPNQVVHRRMGRVGTHLHITNNGNFDEDFELNSSAHERLQITPQQPIVHIPMGQSLAVPISLVPLRGAGRVGHLWFRVTARGITGREPEQEERGSYSIPLPYRPVTLYSLLVGLLLLLVAGYVILRLSQGAALADILAEFQGAAQQLRSTVESWFTRTGAPAP